jgi:hypothetical protein
MIAQTHMPFVLLIRTPYTRFVMWSLMRVMVVYVRRGGKL